ncbi:MAG: ATP synthase F0 subunit B [Myxococcota bacterium]
MLFASLALDLDFTYVLVLALLLLPLIILNTLVFSPFMKLFSERHERLEGAIKRANERLLEAEEKAKLFEEKIQVATARGVEVRNTIRAAAQKDMNARVEAERQKLQVKVDAAVKDIRAAKELALKDVDVESRRLAESTASKLLGRGI